MLSGSRHCPHCAAPLETRVPPGDDRPRLVCSACAFVLYVNPKVAAGTVPRDADGRVALIRRGVEPGLGKWSWPCGYVESDETVPGCAVRETREESGLDVALGPLLGIYSYPVTKSALPPEKSADGGAGMIIICYAAVVDAADGIVAGDDATDARWFAPDAIPWADLAFDSAHRGLRDALARDAD